MSHISHTSHMRPHNMSHMSHMSPVHHHMSPVHHMMMQQEDSTPYITIGFVVLSIILGVIAIILGGLAATGYISYQSDSIPGKALKKDNVSLDNVKGTSFGISDGSKDTFTVINNGNTDIGGTLDVTGATNLTGATTLASTLGVEGITNFDGDFTIGGVNTPTFKVTETSGNTDISGTLGVTGLTGIRQDFQYITSTGNNDYSTLTSSTNIFINASLTDTNYIRLPEATTTNGGMVIKIFFGQSSATGATVYVGFVTSIIIGGATSLSANAVGAALGAYNTTALASSNLRVELNDTAAKAGGAAGTLLTFTYPGVANTVLYSGNLIGTAATPTLASHFSTTAVNA